jgi:hypothetical protein
MLKFFDADPGSKIRMEKIRIRDPGWKKFGSGIQEGKNLDSRSGIRDKHPGSAKLEISFKIARTYRTN